MPDRVLVTGVSGFIGSHVALALLGDGYAVRGSLRDLSRARSVRAMLADAGADISALELVALDLMADAGWAEAGAGCRYVVHVASPLTTRMPADRERLVRPAVEGTARAVGAALAAGAERIVLTSSMAAIAYGHGGRGDRPFGPDDWTRLDGRPVGAYVESKTRAERKAWDLMEAAGRRADLVAVNAAVVFGPLLSDDAGTSVGALARLVRRPPPLLVRVGFGIVDVRDVAAVHVAAMISPEAGGRRLPLSAGARELTQIAATLADALPSERARKLPRRALPDGLARLLLGLVPGLRDEAERIGRRREIDADAAIRLLGRPLISPEECLRATAESLLARGLV